MRTQIAIFVFLFPTFFLSCEVTSEKLSQDQKCAKCKEYFSENLSLNYEFTQYEIGNYYGLVEGRRDIESIRNRTDISGRLRVVDKKDLDGFHEHMFCFLGKDISLIKKFISPNIEWHSKDNGAFKNVSIQYDLGEYKIHPQIIDWQYWGGTTLNFKDVEGKYIYIGSHVDSIRLKRCLK